MTAQPSMLFSVEELEIPATLDDPGGGDFRDMVSIRNEVDAGALGSAALSLTPEELLPTFQNQEDDPQRLFLARVDGRIVGCGIYYWSNEAGSRVAWLLAQVHPQFRNRGIGTALFDRMEAIARAMDRTVIQVSAIHTSMPSGERIESPTGFGSVAVADPGVRFLRNRGYSLEQIARCSFLDVPVDPGMLAAHRAQAEAAAGPDYEVVSWVGLTPERWRADLAYLKNRMSVDEPAAGLEIDEEMWDEARVIRRDEAELAGGRDLLTVAALHVPSGRLVGHSELSVAKDRTRPVSQIDTLVISEHRGHRLGMLLKVANLQVLAEFAPEASLVYTFNAEENRHMLNVNEAVGFRATGYDGAWKKMTGAPAS